MASVPFVSRGGPLLTPRGAYLLQTSLGGGLIETKAFRGTGFFNLEKTMLSVLHKELECKVEKFKVQEAAWLAQLGERRSAKREVAGSNRGRTNT